MSEHEDLVPSLSLVPGRSLAGQVAVVTGASRGLGAVFARSLAERGAAVALFARSEAPLRALAEEIRSAGGRAIVVVGDATDPVALRELVTRTEAELGPIDLFVANAGVFGPIGRLWESDPLAWWSALEINLKGPMLACHAVLPGMVSRGRGRVVLLSSHAGHHRWPTVSSYSVSKCGVIKLAENLGRELRHTGVRLWAWHPGFTTTGLTDEALAIDAAPDSAAGRLKTWAEQMLQSGEALLPEESAEALLAIAEGEADHRSGDYLTVEDLRPVRAVRRAA